MAVDLTKRYYCDAYGCYNYNSSWYTWGRWVLLGAIILFVLFLCLMVRCINSRRIKRGGGPVRYTGWTVPTYNQSQQQYGYTDNAYNMNNNPQGQYPAGQYPQQSYQGAPADGYTAPAGAPGSSPAYYDAAQFSAGGAYQPPAYPPPTTKPRV